MKNQKILLKEFVSIYFLNNNSSYLINYYYLYSFNN